MLLLLAVIVTLLSYLTFEIKILPLVIEIDSDFFTLLNKKSRGL